MQTITGIGTGLAASLLFAWAVLAWRKLREFKRYRRARGFWRPFITDKFQVMMGHFWEFETFEPSGFVGGGDASAVAVLQAHFAEIGGPQFEVSYADAGLGDALQSNLILIGGPGGNRATARVLERANTSFSFRSGRSFSARYSVVLEDRHTGLPYTPEIIADDGHVYQFVSPESDKWYTNSWQAVWEREFLRHDGSIHPLAQTVRGVHDFGLIVSMPNPFAPDKRVLVVAGSFGFGTWAGMQFVTSKQFLDNKDVKRGKAVEVLIRVDVAEQTPQHWDVVDVRPLATPAKGVAPEMTPTDPINMDSGNTSAPPKEEHLGDYTTS